MLKKNLPNYCAKFQKHTHCHSDFDCPPCPMLKFGNLYVDHEQEADIITYEDECCRDVYRWLIKNNSNWRLAYDRFLFFLFFFYCFSFSQHIMLIILFGYLHCIAFSSSFFISCTCTHIITFISKNENVFLPYGWTQDY